MCKITFSGFEQKDFDSLTIEGLEPRMEAIQQRIQPKFQKLGEELVDYLAAHLGNEMHIHIAKHARRTVNPPNDTWVAFSYHKRGYKMTPHFQVGLWDDRLFVWLAYIYELPNKKEIAQLFIDHIDDFSEMIPGDFNISMNHMKKSDMRMEAVDIEKTLTRFRDVKSAELLIGKQFSANDPLITDGEKFMRDVESICDTLIPIYQMSLDY